MNSIVSQKRQVTISLVLSTCKFERHFGSIQIRIVQILPYWVQTKTEFVSIARWWCRLPILQISTGIVWSLFQMVNVEQKSVKNENILPNHVNCQWWNTLLLPWDDAKRTEVHRCSYSIQMHLFDFNKAKKNDIHWMARWPLLLLLPTLGPYLLDKDCRGAYIRQ